MCTQSSQCLTDPNERTNYHTTMNTQRHLLLVVLLLSGLAGWAQENDLATFPIAITLNGYDGHLLFKGREYGAKPAPVTVTLQLEEGDNFIETGAAACSSTGKFCSYLVLSVSRGGQVTSAFPAASISTALPSATIALNTGQVTLKPGGYKGRFYLSSVIDPNGYFTGPANVQTTLIKGITYYIDGGTKVQLNYAGVDGKGLRSDFGFKYTGANNVVLADPLVESAAVSGATLTFNTTTVVIPSDVVLPVVLSSDPQPTTPLQIGSKVQLINGVLAWMRYRPLGAAADKVFYFMP